MRCNLLIQSFTLNKRVKRPGRSHKGVGRKEYRRIGHCDLEVHPDSRAVQLSPRRECRSFELECKSLELECISCFCKCLHFCCLMYTFFNAEAIQETTGAVSSELLAEAV